MSQRSIHSNNDSQHLVPTFKRIPGVNFDRIRLKFGSDVPKLRVHNPQTKEVHTYSLLGDRYLIGRSSRSCDIAIANDIVSQIHCSIYRKKGKKNKFLIKDEGSTNGTYLKKRRFKKLELRHGDRISLGPTELENAVTLIFNHLSPTWHRWLRLGLYGFVGLFSLLLLLIGWQWSDIPVKPLPTSISGPVVVYARDQTTPLSPLEQRTHQDLAKLTDFSPYLPQAVIASEDSRFYWHLGVDPLGVIRAVKINLKADGIRQGASTLTQQLARSLFPEVGRENTAGRKWREMVVALKLEAHYSKDKLLLLYLNRVYLGSGNYGFEDAAQFYFEKSARDLTLSEAATLVAMLPAPNSFNPVQNFDLSMQLRNRVLKRMAQLGMISTQEAAKARRSRIDVSPKAREALSKTVAPYFYSYVFQELRQLLGSTLAQEGNFIVETELDPMIQTKAERALRNSIDSDGRRYGYSQGAIVTLDSRTGAIVAMVGGKDYQQSQYNRAVQAQRQPGSTFKVFAYASALERGMSPHRAYSCAALSWRGQQFKPCERTAAAEANLYEGLAQSENAIALRVAKEVGLNRVMKLAQRLGIDSPLKPVPGLILGQSEVNLQEITGAYATFANQGVWNRPQAIRRILDGGDCQDVNLPQTCREIYGVNHDQTAQGQEISPDVAQTMTALMQGAVQQGTGRSARLGLGEAGKTGTTNSNIDLWFIGYIPSRHLVTGVWLGNDKPQSTQGSSAQAAQLWGNYMKSVIN